MKNEIMRKLIHFSSLLYPVLYQYFLTKNQILYLTGVIAVFLIIVDFGKKRIPFIRKLFNRFFSKISREEELKGGFYGSTYFMIGAFLTIYMFEKQIAVLAILVLVISDALASLIGKAIPSKKIIGSKSVAGFLSFLFSASIICAFVNLWLILPAFLTAIAELFAKKLKIDDNLLIPIFFGTISTLLLVYV